MLELIALAITLSGCPAPTAASAASTAVIPASPASAIPAPRGQPSPLQAAVGIRDFAFDPQEVCFARAGTVTWTNHDSTTHTVRLDDAESPGFGTGGTFSKTFNDAATDDYHCGLHPSMAGKVVVE